MLSGSWQDNSHTLFQTLWHIRSFIRMLSLCSKLALNWQPTPPSDWMDVCRLRCTQQTDHDHAVQPQRLANQLPTAHFYSVPFCLAAEASSEASPRGLVSTLVYCLLAYGSGSLTCSCDLCIGVCGIFSNSRSNGSHQLCSAVHILPRLLPMLPLSVSEVRCCPQSVVSRTLF